MTCCHFLSHQYCISNIYRGQPLPRVFVDSLGSQRIFLHLLILLRSVFSVSWSIAKSIHKWFEW